MPMLISTGKCPSPSGRKTSALSLAPSRIGMSTSFSIVILYRGSDALVSSRVATCSCTVPPNGLAFASNAIRQQGLRLCRCRSDTSRRAPHLARGLDHEAQLGDLASLVHSIAADAAGKSALRAQCELLQRGMLARLVDATLELLLRFEFAALGRDQTEDGHLAPGQKTQRFEAARARAVVFEKIAIHVDFVEDELGDRLVAAVRHPRAGEIAAAKVHARRHVPRPILDRGIEELGVGPRQPGRILADIGDLLAQLRIAQVGEVDLVDLQIAAAGRGEVADFLAVDTGKIVVEGVDVGIGLGIDRAASAPEMHDRWRRERDLRRRPRDGCEKFEIVDEDSLAVGPRELAGDLHGRRAVQAVAFGRMKAYRELGRDHSRIAEFQHEISVPGVAVVFAVGDELEPELLLQSYHLTDCDLLDTLELGIGDLFFLRLLARVDESGGPDEAADMLGAEGRLGAFHWRGSPLQRPTDVVLPDDSTGGCALM